MRATAVVIAVGAGCHTPNTASHDAMADAPGSDAQPLPSCADGTAPIVFDDFLVAGSNACGAVGSFIFSDRGTAMTGGGWLTVTTIPGQSNTASSSAACFWSTPAALNPFNNVSSLMVTVRSQLGGTAGVSLVSGGESVEMQGVYTLSLVHGTTQVASTPAQNAAWRRFRPLGTTGVAADYSIDGMGWNTLGSVTWSAGSNTSNSIALGVDSLMSSGIAAFGPIYLCR